MLDLWGGGFSIGLYEFSGRAVGSRGSFEKQTCDGEFQGLWSHETMSHVSESQLDVLLRSENVGPLFHGEG